MTEERESAPNQAPDTDQATHQRPPQVFAGTPLYGQAAGEHRHRPRLSDHGGGAPARTPGRRSTELQLLHHVFTQLTGFLDMGTSTCFYNALSRRQYEMPLVAFMAPRVSALVFLVTMLGGVFLLVPGLGDMLLPDVPLWYAPLRLSTAFCCWGTRVVRSMNDALGLTVPGELAERVNLLRGHHHSGAVLVPFPERGEPVRAAISDDGKHRDRVPRHHARSWAHIDLSLTCDQRLSYTREFSDYSMPLFVQALLSRWPSFPPNAGCSSGSTATQQGYFAVPTRQRRVFLFVSAMTPLIMRELAIAWGRTTANIWGTFLTRFAPLLFGIAAWFSCFTAVEASVLDAYFRRRGVRRGARPRADHGPVSGPSGLRATGKLRFPCHRQDQGTAEPCLYRALRGFLLVWLLVAPQDMLGMGLGATGLPSKP